MEGGRTPQSREDAEGEEGGRNSQRLFPDPGRFPKPWSLAPLPPLPWAAAG